MTLHRFARLFVVLLAALALPGLTVALAQDDPGGPPAFDPEVEPNDDFWSAWGLDRPYEAAISPARDKDFWRFDGYPTLDAQIMITLPPGSKLKPVLTLYDPEYNQVARVVCGSAPPCLTYPMTQEGFYYVRVTDNKNRGGAAYGYTIDMAYGDPHEWNDDLVAATPIEFGVELTGVIEYGSGDVDIYSFTAEAEQEFQLYSPTREFRLLGPGGVDLGTYLGPWMPIIKVEMTGVYYLKFEEQFGEYVYHVQVRQAYRPLLLSFDGPGTIGGVDFEAGDIARYSPLHGTWEMYFDASDLGLAGNLVAFNNIWLLAFDTPQTHPDLLTSMKPQDVVRFHGDTVDGQTTGWLEMIVDGSDVGLTTASEAIDALASDYNGRIAASFKGAITAVGNPRRLVAQKDDIAAFEYSTLGETTGGYWFLDFNGATLGRHKANVIGAAGGPAGGYYLLFDKPVTLNGVTYARNDIIACRFTMPEQPDGHTCATTEKAFDGTLVGGYFIDGIDVLDYVIE